MTSSLPLRRGSVVFGETTVSSIPLPDRNALASFLPLLSAASPDDLQLLIVLTGAVHVAEGPGTTSVLPAGAALVSTGDSAPAITALGDTALALISTSSQHLTVAPLVSRALTIPADRPFLSLMTTLVTHALSISDELTWMSRHIIENMLADALSHLIADTTRHNHSPRGPDDPFVGAITQITASSADPDLRAEDIARHANISLRQLERAFRKRGTTIAREIRRARVDHALSLLNDHTRATLTINEIARNVGFSNNSSLARAMSAEGHNPPQASRHQAPGSRRHVRPR